MGLIQPGFFTMQDATHVLRLNLVTAKQHCLQCVDTYVARHPGTDPLNVQKVRLAIERARTVNTLALAVSNFVLAHPSEGLKVMR